MRSLSSLAFLLAALPAAVAAQATPVAFVNVDVLPMDGERVIRDQTVVIHRGMITAMGNAATVAIPAGATRVSARGKYLMPGVAEMHAHIPPGAGATDEAIRRVLALYALNGVTTVRGMLGDPKHLPYRDMAARGELLSPRIWTSGPSLNGNSVPTPEAARQAVQAQKAAGYDLLKIHPGIQRETFDTLAATAHRVGIPFAGHVPLAVGLQRALEARFASIDHIDGYIEALVREGAPLSASQSQWFGMNLVDNLDWSKLPALVRATRDAGVWVVPTQSLFESTAGTDGVEQLRARPGMGFWPSTGVDQWATQTTNLRNTFGVATGNGTRFLAARHRILKALHDGGVKFLLGSDAPQMWNVPGFSIQHELDGLVASGLTPYQALESGTRNVAEYLGLLQESGTVAVGKRADLILLDGNPLQNISAFSSRAGVVVGGRWIDRAEIERRLAAMQ